MTFDIEAMRWAKKSKVKDWHWIGPTLMGKEFGEVVELLIAEWSELDEWAPEHAALIAMAPDMADEIERLTAALEEQSERITKLTELASELLDMMDWWGTGTREVAEQEEKEYRNKFAALNEPKP